ncbi:MBL fold metallo-hydrolase [Cytophagaceae bacterium YF14B1]|uniref:MBL fold metallo-hydrolase n=1 Tax=Xanthocytophaga flava TaxID=3048013 RepID=A0AAE3QSG8_9BACT|nr:MBL fold metallo-hydrolase [Xanthocytophaga flavus]MDJ1482675.1 MBL fold metallo-hydrolase [Xanthocytophaga flavus]
MKLSITHIDTACVLLDINGYKILTDPTLDAAGHLYYHGSGTFSRKTEDPALPVDKLPAVDLVLLSHHQHKDNFDRNGQEFTKTVPTVISTKPAARTISGAIGLDDWESYKITTQSVTNLTITATPAQHHPWWVPEFLVGKVIGFIIAFDEQKNGVIYISGDTVYFKGIAEVGRRYKIDVGIFHLGSVQFRYLTGFGQYTMDSNDLLKAVKVLDMNKIIPIHHKGWTHFKQTENKLKEAIARNEQLHNKTLFLTSGVQTPLI